MAAVYQWALDHPSDRYQAFKTQTTMLEFQNPHINKGTGLQHAVELLGIDLENVVAFGDMSNDNPMLRRDLSRWFSAKGYQKSNGAATRHLYGSPSAI